VCPLSAVTVATMPTPTFTGILLIGPKDVTLRAASEVAQTVRVDVVDADALGWQAGFDHSQTTRQHAIQTVAISTHDGPAWAKVNLADIRDLRYEAE